MTSYTISDTDLDAIKDQVVIITGASSGIGLATLRRILKHGGKVFASDLNPLPSDVSSTPFLKVDVTSWADQVALFKAAAATYGHIDHVFANAGIKPSFSLLEEDVDENGDLQPPSLATYNVNIVGVTYTMKLGLYYLKRNPRGGSLVLTASASSFSKFPTTDYTASKHAVLGLLRGLHPQLPPTLRLNAIAPSYTDTGIIPPALLAALGPENYQSADVVARSVVNLMASSRNAELCYSDRGRYLDFENGERGYHACVKSMLGVEEGEEVVAVEFARRMREVMEKAVAEGGA
ncbi:hypothetical protein J1614_006498 [Plenodomus biglobosus]|nr:hypothetical protein J1614_006498 [Plenodomus biglobosus]